MEKSEIEYFQESKTCDDDVRGGKIFVDRRNGNFFTVLAIANAHSTNPDVPVVVVYQGIDGKIWTKTILSFCSKMRPFFPRK